MRDHPRLRFRNSFRRHIPSLAASFVVLAVVVGAGVAWGSRGASGAGLSIEDPPDIEEAVASIMDVPCIALRDAQPALSEALLQLGHPDWQVSVDDHADATGCVSASIRSSQRKVHLEPALRPEVRDVLERVANDLVDSCLTRSQAVEHITTALHGVGETEWELRTDGPRGGPANRVEEIKEHVAAGCFLYGGVGWKTDGTRVYLIGGWLE